MCSLVFKCFNSISELPECQLQLAQQKEVLQNALFLSLAPCYTIKLSIVVVNFILNLSQNQVTHIYLSQPYVISALLRICEVQSFYFCDEDEGMTVKTLQ